MRSEEEIRERSESLCDLEADGPHRNSRPAIVRRARIRELRWVLEEDDDDEEEAGTDA